MIWTQMRPPPLRSFLFAPASRPDLLAKAATAGADVVCADLEDAVAPADKPAARSAGFAHLQPLASSGSVRALRINSPRGRYGLEDLLALLDAPAAGLLCLPKVESADELIWVADLLGRNSELRLVAFIETPLGLERAAQIAAAPVPLAALVFGAVDFCTEMDIPLADDSLAYARGRLAHAARLAGVELIDVPCVEFRDLEEVARQARLARRLGFTGKAAIHPSNIAAINAAFSPTESELAQAQAIVEASRQARGGVTTLNGKLVEEPIVRRMRRMLETYRPERQAQ